MFFNGLSLLIATVIAAAAPPPDLSTGGFKDAYNYMNILAARRDPTHGHDPNVDRTFWADVRDPVVAGAGKGSAPDYFFKQPAPKFYLSKIFSDDLLIVVHADQRFDEHELSKLAIINLQRELWLKLKPIVHLYDIFPSETWFAEGAIPSESQISHNGENSIRVQNGSITLVGGFWGQCYTIAMLDLIRQHFWVSQAPLHINLPTTAVYAHDRDFRPTRLDIIAAPNRIEFIRNDVLSFFAQDWAGSTSGSNPLEVPAGPNLNARDFTLRFNDEKSGATLVAGNGKHVVEFDIH